MSIITNYNTYENSILDVLISKDNHTVENLDLLTAFYLGMSMADKAADIKSTIQTLFERKMGLKFIDRLTAITSSTALSVDKKNEVLDPQVCPEPLKIISRVNQITGKTDATAKIAPFADKLQDPEFHRDFLDYEAQAHNQVVGGLIDTLTETNKKIPNSICTAQQQSKKNTLKNLYNGSNVGKTFVSVDLRQANWTALRYWDPSLPQWNEMLSSLLPEGPLKPMFLESKMFRQVTLGVALKKHGLISRVEATQVMLVKKLYGELNSGVGKPFSESNDELIFEWFWSRREVTPWFKPALNDPRFKVTIQYMKEKTHDDCYEFEYEELGAKPHKYRLLRCYNPEKVESRL